MSNIFKLSNTYEMLLKFKDTSRPVRIEIFCGIENPNLFRARVWDQNTYNLYPTMLNIDEEGGLKNKMYSCDEINREITLTIADEATLISGKEYSSEEVFLNYVQSLVMNYQAMLNE